MTDTPIYDGTQHTLEDGTKYAGQILSDGRIAQVMQNQSGTPILNLSTSADAPTQERTFIFPNIDAGGAVLSIYTEINGQGHTVNLQTMDDDGEDTRAVLLARRLFALADRTPLSLTSTEAGEVQSIVEEARALAAAEELRQAISYHPTSGVAGNNMPLAKDRAVEL
jgi:hypothetical protein